MPNSKFILIILFLIPVMLFTQPCFAETRKLTIVFTGDSRGELENCHCPKDDFGGLERRSNYVNEVRKENNDMLLLDVGDTLPLFNSDCTKKIITCNAFISLRAMDMMGYDAMNVGESDLILGEVFLKEKASNLKFPLISSNIVDKSQREPFFKPYIIKIMKNGLRVGILGVTNERYIINSKKLEIAPNKEMAEKYVEELKDKVDLVIVLGHLGIPYSIGLANSVKGIDVILSGHWDAETQEPMKVGNSIIMPSCYHCRKVGRLNLEIGDTGGVSSYDWQSVAMDAKYEGEGFIKKLASMAPVEKKQEEKPFTITRKITEEPRPVLREGNNIAEPEKSLRVLVFYAVGCRSCMEVERDVLPRMEKKYGSKIGIEKYDIGISKNYAQMVRLEKLYGAEGGYVPEVIVSRYVLMGKESITEGLDKAIEKALSEPVELQESALSKSDVAGYESPAVDSVILSRFNSFGICAVTLAGFLDGINPCAFTTIVFFISFLALMGYRKREMIFAGSFFTIAVFIAYFTIGLGIFKFLRVLSAFSYMAIIVNFIIGGLAFSLGILSLVDYFRFRKTKDAKSSILQLPDAIKNRIHSVIGLDFRQDKFGQRKALLKIAWIALSSGFIVSILESICTGQVYLPTIAYVLRMPDKHISALSYLLIYNLAFIMPLVIVFILVLFGATSNALSKFMQKRFGVVKLSTALLFFVLAAVLVIFK